MPECPTTSTSNHGTESGSSESTCATALPVTALLSRPGGHVVEVTGPSSSRRYVPVTPGIFDDNAGMVQVIGNLTPGERVVVAAS